MTIETIGGDFGRERSEGDASERGNSGNPSSEGAVCEFRICNGKEGCRVLACDQLEEVKSIHTLSALQDGVSGPPEGSPPAKRLNGKSGYEGRLLLHSSGKGVSKVCKVPLERKTLPVPMPVLRVSPCPLSVFSKLLKAPTALLRRLNIRLIIYLDDILIMGQSQSEIDMAREISTLRYNINCGVNTNTTLLLNS